MREDVGEPVASDASLNPRPRLAGPVKRRRDKNQLAYRAAVAAGFESLPDAPITEASISVLLPTGDYGLLAVCKNLVDALVSARIIADDRASVGHFRAMRAACGIDDPFTVPTTEVQVVDLATGTRYRSSSVLAPAADVPAIDPVQGIAYTAPAIEGPEAYAVALEDVVVAEDVVSVDFDGGVLFAIIGGKHTCDPDNALMRVLDAVQLRVGDGYLVDDVLAGVAYTKDVTAEGVRVWLRNDQASQVPFEEFVAYFLTGDEPPLAILVGNPDIPTL